MVYDATTKLCSFCLYVSLPAHRQKHVVVTCLTCGALKRFLSGIEYQLWSENSANISNLFPGTVLYSSYVELRKLMCIESLIHTVICSCRYVLSAYRNTIMIEH